MHRNELEKLETRTLFSASSAAQWAQILEQAPAIQRQLERQLRSTHTRDVDIFGADSRFRPKSTSMYPFSAVGRLESKWTRFDAGLQGSAVLVSPRHILTAAHCVYDRRDGYADHITFAAGQDDWRKPFGTARVTQIRIEKKYRKSEDVRFDYALLTLDKPIGKQAGWLDVESLGSRRFRRKNVYSTGYPGDLSNDGDILFHQVGRAFRASDHEILTALDTGIGQSGSPVYIKAHGDYIVAGVITSSTDKFSYAVRITSSREDLLDFWMEQDLG